MRTPIIFFLVCSFILSIGQETKNVKTELSDVTLYTLGAMITEKGSVSLNKGINRLVFTNIARTFNPRILLLQFSGNTKVISMSSAAAEQSTWKINGAYRSILDSIEIIDKQKLTNSYTISGLNGEKQMLDENRNIGGTVNGVLNVELQKAVEYYRLRISDINQLLLAAIKTESSLNKLLAELNKRKTEMEVGFMQHNNIIYATVNSETVETGNFELSYFVDDCGWAPFYDIKITDISKPVNFVYNAKMYNNTGVSWNDVNLVVSTADPGKTAQYPKLEKWVLGQTYDDGTRTYRTKYKSSDNEGYYDSKANNQNKGETVINASALSIDFAIADKKTIPSDAHPYIVEMKNYNISPAYNYIAIPKLDALAYLTCNITDWEQYNFMDGPANVYYGKTFIGASFISPVLADDTLEVSLGRDPKVMLKYEKKKDFTRKSILGNTIIQTFTYEITIHNANPAAINLDLFDQVPISPSSDISVDVNEISKADWTKEDGKLQWNINIKAGETAKYIVSYTVKYPKGRHVQVIQYRALKCPSF